MSVEELQAEYKRVLGKEAAGPHKNKVAWLEKKIAEAKDETVGTQKLEKEIPEAKHGFQIDRAVKVGGVYYARGSWVDEDDANAEILKQFKI